MKILIIDNNIDRDCWGSENLARFARRIPEASITVRRAPQGDLPRDPREFDRVLVSGSKTSAIDPSPWVGQLDEFIRSTVDAGIPYLGVCYGHQSLVRAIAGEKHLRNATCPEYGWTEIEVTDASPIFRDLPPRFYSYSTHSDEVTSLPASFRKKAQSKACGIQACELVGKPAFGIQFHPEKDLADGTKSLRDVIGKKPKDVIFNPARGADLFDASVGDKIFGNFLRGEFA